MATICNYFLSYQLKSSESDFAYVQILRYEDSYVAVDKVFSSYLKWLELLCQLLTTVGTHTHAHRWMCAHLPTHARMQQHTQPAHREKHSVERRANQLSNHLSVLIFIIQLWTYGFALIRKLCVFLYLCILIHKSKRTKTKLRQSIAFWRNNKNHSSGKQILNRL